MARSAAFFMLVNTKLAIEPFDRRKLSIAIGEQKCGGEIAEFCILARRGFMVSPAFPTSPIIQSFPV